MSRVPSRWKGVSTVNHKRLYRLYRAAGLQVRRRRRKRLTRGERVPLPAPTQRGERWWMDSSSAWIRAESNEPKAS